MEYKIIRSKRRTISLVIDDKANLIVRAPIRISDVYITKLVMKKQGWILKKQREILKREKIKKKEFINGEKFLYLGNNYELKRGEYKEISLDKYLLLPNKYIKKEFKKLTQWYQQEALEIFFERVKVYTKMTGWKCNQLQLSNAKRQWGVCDNKNRIKLNWRLIMAPLEIIDYVIIHELAHTVEHNHSKKFWEKVAVIIPDYKIKRQWLKDNSKYLNIE